LICQYFLQQVLAGASLGRAALEARQQFARSSPELDPTDIKTIAQFNLLGDPSIQPVKAPAPPEAVKLLKGIRAFRGGMDLVSLERHARRRQLIGTGIQLIQTQAVASKRLSERVEPSIDLKMRALAAANGIKSPELISFSVERPALSMTTGMKGRFKALVEDMPAPNAFHVAIGKIKTDHPKIINLALLVAKEQDGQLVSVRKLLSR
jgi:limonene-1,2-epoxide hydrolase